MSFIDFGLLGFIAVNVLTAMSGAVFKPGAWYETLKKPWWNPPKWAFPVAWMIIFAMIAVAGWSAWKTAGSIGAAPWAFFFYFLQLAFNAGWSAVFFGLKRPDLALIEVGFMWTAVLINTVLFFMIDTTAGLLMVVYLLWTTFAARLNYKITELNPRRAGMQPA